MALSGNVQTSAWTSSNGYDWRIVLNWTATQSIATNKSTISWNIKCSTSQGGYVVVGEVRATINGKEVFYRPTSDRSNCSNGTQIASGTIEVEHNNDGSKSVDMKIEAGIYVWAITETGSKTFTLDTIPRASSITSASNVTLGNACGIKWTPNAASFRFKVKFSLGSWSYTTGAIHPNTTSEYTYSSYTIPLAAANQLPSATTGTMTATLYTYTDSAAKNQCGSATTKTFTVTVPSSVVPTIGTLTATIDNSANSVVNGWGLAVAGYTKVKVTATASVAYSSTISSFEITGGYSNTVSGTSLNYNGGIITSSGKKTFDVVAKDSRGRSSTQALSDAITFYAYSKPKISSFTTARDTTNPNLMVVKGNWSYSSVNSKNSATGTLYYKKSTETEWTKYGAISKNTSTTLTTEFSQTISYNFRLVVTDSLSNSAQEETFVSTIEVLLNFRAGGKGLGIGKVAETDSLEIALDTVLMGGVYIMVGTEKVTLEDYIKSING